MLPAAPTGANSGIISTQPPLEPTFSRSDDDSEFANESTSKQVKAKRIRKVYTPNVIELELKSSAPTWKDFATGKAPATDIDKYLCCMVWLKENLQVLNVTVDHVYTLYKAAGWPTKLSDFGQPFRSLKASGFVHSVARGEFKINHLERW